MNKDFVLDFVAGGMDYPVHVHPVYSSFYPDFLVKVCLLQ